MADKIQKVKYAVKKFFEEYINSRMAPEKKDNITQNKVRKQKYYLNDTRKNLHREFYVHIQKCPFIIQYFAFINHFG